MVKRLQRKIALNFRHKNLANYIERDSISETADVLTRHFFPLAHKRGYEAADQIKEIYAHWLVLVPATSKYPLGYWRPWWTRQVWVSWFRQNIGKFKRFHLGFLEKNWNKAELSQGAEVHRIEDPDFMESLSDFLGTAEPGYLRGELARLVLGPLVVGPKALDLLEVCKKKKSGFWWFEGGCLVLSQKTWEHPGLRWIDLREQSFELEKYVFWVKNGQFHVEMNLDTIKKLKSEIRAILAGKTTPQNKIRLINQKIAGWYHIAKYAPNARKQVREFERDIFKLVNRSLIQIKPELAKKYFNLRNATWHTDFVVGRKQSLLDGLKLENELWLNFWSPRR